MGGDVLDPRAYGAPRNQGPQITVDLGLGLSVTRSYEDGKSSYSFDPSALKRKFTSMFELSPEYNVFVKSAMNDRNTREAMGAITPYAILTNFIRPRGEVAHAMLDGTYRVGGVERLKKMMNSATRALCTGAYLIATGGRDIPEILEATAYDKVRDIKLDTNIVHNAKTLIATTRASPEDIKEAVYEKKELLKHMALSSFSGVAASVTVSQGLNYVAKHVEHEGARLFCKTAARTNRILGVAMFIGGAASFDENINSDGHFAKNLYAKQEAWKKDQGAKIEAALPWTKGIFSL